MWSGDFGASVAGYESWPAETDAADVAIVDEEVGAVVAVGTVVVVIAGVVVVVAVADVGANGDGAIVDLGFG